MSAYGRNADKSGVRVSVKRENIMNPFDIVIVVIFGFCLIRGTFRGLVKEVSSIVGVFGGFYAAYTYYGRVAVYLKDWFTDSAYLNIISFLVVFCVVFLVISVLGVVIKYIMNIAFLGWADRIGGAFFGILKALLIASVLFITLAAFLPQGAPVIRNSKIAPHVTKISEQLVLLVPDNLKQSFSQKIQSIKKEWNKSR